MVKDVLHSIAAAAQRLFANWAALLITLSMYSALLGAIYLLLVDNIARTATVAELPIGIITALIGVPVFALILRRMQSRSGWAHD